MTRKAHSAFIGFLVAVPCLGSNGCLLPYAYPKLDYVPAYDPGMKIPDCYAFRVDVTAHEVDVGESSEFTLTPIALRPDGSVPPQVGVSVERGYHVFGPLNFN